MGIPEKLDYLKETKNLIKEKIDSTGQNTNRVPFSNYANLINNIPNCGSFPQSDIQRMILQTINISGEKA